MKLNRLVQITVFSIVALAISVGVLFAQSDDNQADVIRVDVAENASRFAFDPSNAFEDGSPAYGSSFVTEGYIYPEGTLNGSNGVLEDGSPEFPDLVIGEWTCFGSFVGNGMYTESGAMVITNQVFSFYGDEGHSTIVSTGFELADIDVPVDRAITGGTGRFAGINGSQVQTLLGFTEQFGVNLRVELHGTEAIGFTSATTAELELSRAYASIEALEIYPWDAE